MLVDQNIFWNLLAKKLSGEASFEEIEQLELLIKNNPAHSYAAQNITDLWLLEAPAETKTAEEAFEKHLQLLNQTDFHRENGEELMPGSTRSKKRWIAAVMVGALAVGLFATIRFGSNKTNNDQEPAIRPQHAEIYTKPGSRTKLVLPDSSVVWLNAGSRLTYDRHFGISNRNTTLTGEAFFEVKKSSTPFIIHTNTVKVRVLGTAFNIKSYPDEPTTETSLIRGRVEVMLEKRPGEIFVLKPNEKLVVANSPEKEELKGNRKQPFVVIKSLTHVDENSFVETSWVNDQLVFHEESFAEVARKMERWYDVQIEIEEPKLAQMIVGGGPFVKESIQEALTALQIAFNFKFSIKENQIIITR